MSIKQSSMDLAKYAAGIHPREDNNVIKETQSDLEEDSSSISISVTDQEDSAPTSQEQKAVKKQQKPKLVKK